MVKTEELIPFRRRALQIAQKFDVDDWPFIALALKLRASIWTNDKELIRHSINSFEFLAIDTIILLKALKGEVQLENWRAVKADFISRGFI